MKYFFMILLISYYHKSISQVQLNPREGNYQEMYKLKITTSEIQSWPKLGIINISSNGNYCSYVIDDPTSHMRYLILRSTTKKWNVISSIKGSCQFTSNGKKAIWINKNDSLCISTLGSSTLQYVANTFFASVTDDYILYQSIRMKLGKKSHSFETFNQNSKFPERNNAANSILVLKNREKRMFLKMDSTNHQTLEIIHKKKVKQIWQGERINNLIKSENNSQIAFFSGKREDSLWYYKLGMDTAILVSLSPDSTVEVAGLSNFSKNGDYLFINLNEKIYSEATKPSNDVNVWSYLDSQLQSEQLLNIEPKNFKGILRMTDLHFMRLDYDNDWLILPSIMDTVALIRHQNGLIPIEGEDWNTQSNFSWEYVSIRNGQKTALADIPKNAIINISPSGKYLVYYDRKRGNYFSINFKTNMKKNITENICENWENDLSNDNYRMYIAGWETNDKKVFIYGEYDIWQIDPAGKVAPLNLTNGYGRMSNTKFFFSLDEYSHRYIRKNERVILSAFNQRSKDNGFYKKKTGKEGQPDSLTMGPYIYNIGFNRGISSDASYSPIKASRAKRYIVRRMDAIHSPNYFFTLDFKKFNKLSDLQPQQKYNWYTTELHSWRSIDNRILQGILYKPENFCPEKKYPILLYFYEKKSDGLNKYIEPQVLDNGCGINIPYFVSNEYIVFCPDIYYTVGDPMKGTYDAIISAANYLSNLPYIDRTKMGIQGCSWGGVQANYLVTHSDIFAAACSASGVANWTSSYGSIMLSGGSMQELYENGQFRMGSSLWQKPQKYMDNSAVLHADKISTPLLLMHTRKDEIFTFPNALELFIALRRLGKKSWMLTYDGNHGIFGIDGIDFSIRMKQFFDHYLKSVDAPDWMTKPTSRVMQ